MTDTHIATIKKSEREQIHIALRSYRGHTFVDLRVYTVSGSEFFPTPKGISIRPDLLQAAIDALEAARLAAIDEGLLK